MAPHSPLPGTSQARTLLNPNRPKYSLLFGQSLPQHSQPTLPRPPCYKLSASSEKESSYNHSRTHSQNRHGDSKQEHEGRSLFDFDHISLAFVFCLFIATLWLLAAFSAASVSLSLPLVSEYNETQIGRMEPIVEASVWGEIGLYEMNSWRRVREGDKSGLGVKEHRIKRNEAVLGALNQKMKSVVQIPTKDINIPTGSSMIDFNDQGGQHSFLVDGTPIRADEWATKSGPSDVSTLVDTPPFDLQSGQKLHSRPQAPPGKDVIAEEKEQELKLPDNADRRTEREIVHMLDKRRHRYMQEQKGADMGL